MQKLATILLLLLVTRLATCSLSLPNFFFFEGLDGFRAMGWALECHRKILMDQHDDRIVVNRNQKD